MRKLPLLAAALILVSGTAFAADPAMVGNTDKGKALVDAQGMALYTFDKDEKGKTNCYGKCADNWPPLMAPSGAKAMGDWTVVSRTDGGAQWAYKGMPLYGWIKDTKPGETTGDGVGGVWHLAKP